MTRPKRAFQPIDRFAERWLEDAGIPGQAIAVTDREQTLHVSTLGVTDLAPHGLYESWALRLTRCGGPPGEYFWHSNIGYETLGFLLEHRTGHTLQEVIRSRVLNPLGMPLTALSPHDDRPKNIG